MYSKTGKFKNKKLLSAARGEGCTVNLPCCNHNTETTVAAHINRLGHGKMGGKTHDFHIVFACSSCHDEIDRRTTIYERYFVRLETLEGLLRTQNRLHELGLLK
ncbi:MAG: nuclease domain-containing protein [Ostreibacterium sp.]